MQGQDHLYFLLDDQNRSLYVENGIVKRSASPRPLEFTPDGWRKIKVDNQRNQKYFALDRMYTVPLEFVEDGAQILKFMKYTYGSEVKVYLGILKQKLFYDGAEYGYYHDKFIKGEIDFSNYVRSGPKVTVNIMEGGLSKLIKNRENNKYVIPIDVPDAVKIKMDGINLKYNLSFLTTTATYNLPHSSASSRQWLITFVKSSVEGSTLYLTASDVITQIDNSIDYATDQRYFLSASGAINVDAVFKFAGAYKKTLGNSNVDYRLRLINQNGTTVRTFFDENRSGFPAVNEPFSITDTFNLSLNAEDRLFLVLDISVNATDALQSGTVDLTESISTFDYFAKYRTTYVKGLPPSYVFKWLIDQITNGAYQAECPILDANPDFVLTSGDALRGLPGAELKLSLAEFFQSFNTQFDIGMGEIGGKVRLDEKYKFIDYSNPIDLGEVSNFKDKPATDYYFSNLKIGYPEQDYDNVNGKQEFNNTSEFTSPITRVTKELNLVSSFRADCYGAEFTRMNLDGKTTTDSDSDNDVWIIHTNKTPIADPVEGNVYELNRDLNPFASGLIDSASVFNLNLSPKRCLERNGRYIHSGFYKMDTESLVFQDTQKNKELATTTPPVIEKANVKIGGLLDRLFQPEQFEFDTQTQVDLVELLEVSPIRAFKGTFLGFAFTGIPVKVGIAASDFEAQTYTLLASPSTDLTPLIDIYE